MKARAVGIPASVGFAACLLLSLPALAGDDPQVPEASDSKQQLQALIDASVDWYDLLPEADARIPLAPQIAIRWRNATRGGEANALLALWLHDGRPAAAASVFPWNGELCHEFVSFSRTSGLVARDGNAVVWSPNVAGVEFHDVPEAPPPADSPEVRLRQMKSLARRFSATLTGWKSNQSAREELRLLPRELYRYDMKKAEPTHPDLRDGALFAFVQGTDPETLLFLEAVAGDGRETSARWQYAFARATSGGLEARLESKLVWKVDQLLDHKTPTKPQIVLRRIIEN